MGELVREGENMSEEQQVFVQNSLILGRPGVQKNKNIIMPYILDIIDNEESFLALDQDNFFLPRLGEKLKHKGYDIATINLRDVSKSILWSPLTVPLQAYRSDRFDLCEKQLMDIATAIMMDKDVKQSKDPFWELAATDLFVALSLVLFKESKDDNEITIKSIYHIAKIGFSKFSGTTYIEQYLEEPLPENEKIKDIMASVLAAPSETRMSILAVFYQQIRSLMNKISFFENTDTESYDIQKICNNKTAIFVCYEDESDFDIPIVKTFIKQTLGIIIKNQKIALQKRPQFHFILNEFWTLGNCGDIDQIIMVGNKHNISFMFDISDIILLKKIYGSDMAEFIVNYCQEWVIMDVKQFKLLEKMNCTVYMTEEMNNILKIPCSLKENQVLVMKDAQWLELITLNDLDGMEPKFEYIPPATSEKHDVKVFDMKTLVEERRRRELVKSINNTSELNIDSIIDKIDKKIAELELQEQLERARNL